MQPLLSTRSALEDTLATERPRLVGLCAYLTGDALAAEDLAQETLLEAWRNAGKLYDLSGLAAWLSAIARNVCARWLRQAGRQAGRRVPAPGVDLADVPDATDMQEEVEQQELAAFIERALALLPVQTRDACLAHYLHGEPQGAIAARIGISEEALKMRLQRGRAALRRAIVANWRSEIEALGIVSGIDDGWRETRIWCPHCGRRRLAIRIAPPPGVIALRCTACYPDRDVRASEYRLANQYFARLLGGRRQPRAIVDRTAAWNHGYFRDALVCDEAPCTHCGRPTPLRRTTRPGVSAEHPPETVLLVECAACGEVCSTSFSGLVMAHPDLQAFWRGQRRIRALPHREVHTDGCAALVSRFESLTSSATLDIVSASERFEVLHIESSPPAAMV